MVILFGLDFVDVQNFGFAVRRLGALPRLKKVAESETRNIEKLHFRYPRFISDEADATYLRCANIFPEDGTRDGSERANGR